MMCAFATPHVGRSSIGRRWCRSTPPSWKPWKEGYLKLLWMIYSRNVFVFSDLSPCSTDPWPGADEDVESLTHTKCMWNTCTQPIGHNWTQAWENACLAACPRAASFLPHPKLCGRVIRTSDRRSLLGVYYIFLVYRCAVQGLPEGLRAMGGLDMSCL